MKFAVDAGGSIEFAMKRGAPPVHFTREKLVGEALRGWTPARLLRAMEQLAEASLDARRNARWPKPLRNARCCRLPSARRRKRTWDMARPQDKRVIVK